MPISRNPSRRQFVQGVGAAVVGACAINAISTDDNDHAKPQAAERGVSPQVEVPRIDAMQLRGPLGDRAEANVRQWLLVADRANPAMLQIFRDRDRKPPRDLVPWAGEFAGKYLISGAQALRLCRGTATEPPLRQHLESFTRKLIATQLPDG